MKPDQSYTVGADDAFAFLMMAAEEDRDLRGQLVAILSLPSFHRRSLLNTFLRELQMRRAPDELVRCVGYLVDDAVAERALESLKETKSAQVEPDSRRL